MTSTPSHAFNGGRAPASFAIATWLAARSPRWLLYYGSRFAGVVHYCAAAKKRTGYAANTRGVALPHGHRPWHAFQNHALNVFELLRAVRAHPDEIRRRCRIHGTERLDETLRQGRGLILATIHSGNWELSGLRLAAAGYPVTTVAGEQLRPAWSEAVKAIKTRYGIRVVGANTSLRHLYRDLRGNRVVALHLDGNMFEGGHDVSFLGESVKAPPGPARLARVTGAPVSLAYCRRTSRDRLDVVIEPPEPPPPTPACEGEFTRRLMTRAGARIAEAPGQWCVFRRFARTEDEKTR